jgi:dolichyl-phosphate beta-glucosyltransferase
VSLTFYAVLKIYGGIKQTDSQTGMKGFRRASVEPIFKLCEIDRLCFDFEILLIADKLGYKIIEMPVKIINHRESKVNIIKDGFRMLKDIAKIKKRIRKI